MEQLNIIIDVLLDRNGKVSGYANSIMRVDVSLICLQCKDHYETRDNTIHHEIVKSETNNHKLQFNQTTLSLDCYMVEMVYKAKMVEMVVMEYQV